MQVSTQENLDYCKNLIRIVANEKLLQLAFLPPELRGAATAYYGIYAELVHVRHMVSEEMIGHIRYAWWQEAVEEMQQGKIRAHPAIQLLSSYPHVWDAAHKLTMHFREHYPELPPEEHFLLIDHARFQKAGRIIAAHSSARAWLLIKLLFA